MTSLDKPDLGTTTVRWRFPSVHPDGRKFVLIAAAITLLFAFLAWETIAWPMAGITSAIRSGQRPAGRGWWSRQPTG
jgi:phosphatidylserine decarboxylase